MGMFRRRVSLKQRTTASGARRRRDGFTLAELLSVTVVMSLVAATMAALSSAVQISADHQYGQGLAMQHGRVAIERIERTVRGATANEQFPGFLVVSYSLGGYAYPDSLVVWSPEGDPADADGMPRMEELVVFRPDSSDPTKLMELRSVGDTRSAPVPSAISAWQSELEAIQYNTQATRAVLTDLMRVATATNSSGSLLGKRGCVRFEVRLGPSDAEWAEYKAGTRAWENLSWAQDLYGSTNGTRQAWCRVELQLRPGDVDSNEVEVAIPFFGSGALYYQLEK